MIIVASRDFLHWNKNLYEFLMNDMISWGPQKVLQGPQKNDLEIHINLR